MKRKSIVAAALVGALTFGSSVGVFASTNSDVSNVETTTVSSEATTDSSSDSTTSTSDTTTTDSETIKGKHGHKGHGKFSVRLEISALVDEGYTLEDAKSSVLQEKLAEIDAKVADGTLTSEEAESFKEKITEKINSYTGEEASENTTDRTNKRHGSRGNKTSSSTDTSSDTTVTN